nr:hypothetical protein [Desulfobacula sp.]
MTTPHDFALQLTWDLAQESRCCPPDDILFASARSEETRQHLDTCELCRQRLDEGPQEALDELTSILQAPDNLPLTLPAPGQIHAIRRQKSGWGPGTRYYRPPAVLVLETLGTTGVRVAQISGFEIFSWHHDLVLAGNIDGMVETWHTYPVATRDLGPCLENLGNDFLQTVLDQAALADAETRIPPAMVQLFRHMEMETALYFSMPAPWPWPGTRTSRQTGLAGNRKMRAP